MEPELLNLTNLKQSLFQLKHSVNKFILLFHPLFATARIYIIFSFSVVLHSLNYSVAVEMEEFFHFRHFSQNWPHLWYIIGTISIVGSCHRPTNRKVGGLIS